MSAWGGPPAKTNLISNGLGETGRARRWLMTVKRGLFLKSVELKTSGPDPRHEIVQAYVVAEVQAARRRPGDSLDIDTGQARIEKQQLHSLGCNELGEIVRALRD